MDEIDLIKGFRDDMPEPTTDAWLRARAAIAAARAESGHKRARSRTGARWFRPLYVLTVAIVAIVSAATGALLARKPPVTTSAGIPTPVASASPEFLAKVADAIRSDANYIVLTQSTILLANGTVDTAKWYDLPWTGEPGTSVQQTGTEWVDGVVTRGWSLSFTVPTRDLLSAGDDNSCQLAPHGFTVDYPYRTWQSAPPPCVTIPPGLITVSTLRTIGYPAVDGQQTIEFQSVGKNQTFTFWISTSTHLPLQSQTTKKGQWTERDQYTFLMPTSFNQVRLALTPPPGFMRTQVQRAAS
jgi:hypothetical protein